MKSAKRPRFCGGVAVCFASGHRSVGAEALTEAGGTIDSKGKIHLANDEEDELTRENSEKTHDSEENGGESSKTVRRLANPKSVDNLTEEQYNNFGWVRANDVLTDGEWENFTSKFADAVTKQTNPPKTKGGEYMIAVSDIDDALHYGTDNIIVYAKGSIESPQVSRILKIDLDNETDLDRKRRETYDLERRGIQQKAGEIRRFHYASDYGSRYDGQRASRKSIENSGQLGAD